MQTISRENVQKGKVAGPFSRTFDRSAWEKAASNEDVHAPFAKSGLMVFSLLETMRIATVRHEDFPFLLRAIVAIANNEVAGAHLDLTGAFSVSTKGRIDVERLLKAKNAETGASLMETTEALGDSFVYPIRAALKNSRVLQRPTRQEWRESLTAAINESVLCNRWYLAWYFWMDVLWLGATLTEQRAARWELALDEQKERIRQVSEWRRTFHFERHDAAEKERPLVGSTDEVIDCDWRGDYCQLRIRPAKSGEPPWAWHIQSHISLPESSLSSRISKVQLTLPTATVPVGDAITFFAALQSLFFVFLHVIPARELKNQTHIRESLLIHVENLGVTLSKATGLSKDAVDALIEVATYKGGPREQLWGKPLVYVDEANRLVFLPTIKSSILRTINDLIDLYAPDHAVKGTVFQEHVRSVIVDVVRRGPYRDRCWVSQRPIDTAAGDIDVCILVGDVLLIVEVKYVGNAVDAYEYWRAEQRMDEAVIQLSSKLDAIKADRFFAHRLIQQGGDTPERIASASLCPLIVTTDAFHVGFPFKDVPIADLSLLRSFFLNESYVRLELPLAAPTKLYPTPDEGVASVRDFLLAPKEVTDLVGRLKERPLAYPTGCQIEGAGQLFVDVVSVEVA